VTPRARSLRLAVLQHEPETGLGAFAALLDEAHVDYELAQTLRGPLPDREELDGAIALGGSLDVHDARLLGARRWIRDGILRGLPFLGICLGGQLLASALGAVVQRQERPEVGVHDLFLTGAARRDPLFAGLPGRLAVFGWHQDRFEPPRGALPLASSLACTHQAFRFGTAAYGLQFHPEARSEDIARWVGAPAYRGLLDAAGADPERLAGALARATPGLDALARRLLERWLDLASSVAALGDRRLQVA
jgi:GMP synthase (glutamine-hydrolysing)